MTTLYKLCEKYPIVFGIFFIAKAIIGIAFVILMIIVLATVIHPFQTVEKISAFEEEYEQHVVDVQSRQAAIHNNSGDTAAMQDKYAEVKAEIEAKQEEVASTFEKAESAFDEVDNSDEADAVIDDIFNSDK